jgi:hypothetical protein
MKSSVFHIRDNRLFIYALPHECFYNWHLGNAVFTAPCCSGNMITGSLSSNGCLAPPSIFRLSASCHNMFVGFD